MLDQKKNDLVTIINPPYYLFILHSLKPPERLWIGENFAKGGGGWNAYLFCISVSGTEIHSCKRSPRQTKCI